MCRLRREQFDLRTEDGKVHKLQFADATVPLHRWTHVAAVFDGSTARVYVNGIQAGEAQAVSGRIKRTTLPSAVLIIGNEPGSTPQKAGPVQFGNFGWEGLIDDLRCYRRSLDAEAVRACYAATRPVIVETPSEPRSPISAKTAFMQQMQHVFHRWRDPVFFALLLWPLALLVGARVRRSLAVCGGISALLWFFAWAAGRPFIFHPGSAGSIMLSFGLVAAGYGVWRLWVHRIRPGAAGQRVSALVSPVGRISAMMLGGVASCMAAFPAAFIVALVWRLPIPFGGYASGMEGAGKSWFAVLFYGIVGGFPVLGVLGAICGAVAHQQCMPDRQAVVRLTMLLGALVAAMAVGLLTVLDMLIGPW